MKVKSCDKGQDTDTLKNDQNTKPQPTGYDFQVKSGSFHMKIAWKTTCQVCGFFLSSWMIMCQYVTEAVSGNSIYHHFVMGWVP